MNRRSKWLIAIVIIGVLITGGIVAVMSVKPAYADETDEYNLAHLICGEAEGCGRDMMLSVGSVVLNRVSDSRFPNSIAEVIFQPGQYSCTWDGNFYREPSEECWEVARELLKDGTAIDESVVWQAEFPQGVGVYDIIGNMYFCY